MQLETWIIQGTGFHFGRHGMGQEETAVLFSSDSLYAALVSRLVELHGAAAVERWGQAFAQDPPPFALSSAFPRAGGVRFFPRPQQPVRAAKASGGQQDVPVKELKRIDFVSEAVFRRLLAGEPLARQLTEGRLLQNRKVLVDAAELPHLPEAVRSGRQAIWRESQRPRVAIGRARMASNLFFTGQVTFGEACGLWFALRRTPGAPDLAVNVAALLADLGDAGLGGERSSGLGQARIAAGEAVDLPDPDGRAWVTLSRYLPREDEMGALRDERAAYALQTVGGWLQSPAAVSERRRSVHMLAEGSLLGPVARSIPGQVVDVQPVYADDTRPVGHPVWRCGLALAVGCAAGE